MGSEGSRRVSVGARAGSSARADAPGKNAAGYFFSDGSVRSTRARPRRAARRAAPRARNPRDSARYPRFAASSRALRGSTPRPSRRSRREKRQRQIPAIPGTPGDARARSRAARRRTWTLDALRAATEPVKVEAMQAIVEVVMCVVEGVGCAGMALRWPRPPFSRRLENAKTNETAGTTRADRPRTDSGRFSARRIRRVDFDARLGRDRRSSARSPESRFDRPVKTPIEIPDPAPPIGEPQIRSARRREIVDRPATVRGPERSIGAVSQVCRSRADRKAERSVFRRERMSRRKKATFATKCFRQVEVPTRTVPSRRGGGGGGARVKGDASSPIPGGVPQI